MMRFERFFYNPVLPMGKDGRLVTASKKHMAVAKELATEGTVMLKNDGTLPLQKGEKVCLFGRGTGEYIFGGGGSSAVRSNVKISLADALKMADKKGEIQLFKPLIIDAEKQVKAIFDERTKNPDGSSQHTWNRMRSRNALPVSQELYKEAVSFGGVAIFSVLRFSSEGTVDGDRPGGKGDFELFDEEKQLLLRLTKDFKSVVVVLCVCGPVETKIYKDNPKVGAVLYPLYGGSMAGEALVDIITGKAYPSGHLQDTLAEKLSDYPTTESFYENNDYVEYTEDIFVGYRYFETFATEKVVYPFGYGLGYTTFDIKCISAVQNRNIVTAEILVKNTGSRPGKEVVQLYLGAPQGKLGKASRVLAAFKKTKELAVNEEQKLRISFDIRGFASFDDLGKIKKCAFVLENGEYAVFAGNNVRVAKEILKFYREKDTVVSKHNPYMAPRDLKERLTATGEMEKLPTCCVKKHPPRCYEPQAQKTGNIFSLEKALEENKLDEFLANLTDRELSELLYGHISINASQAGYIGAIPPARYLEGENDPKRIPPVPTCDGPAGFRATNKSSVVSTNFPCGNTIAQSFNVSLARKFGVTCAKEIKENNIGIWLAPGLNIHRNPLCGRNFEYMSEDPLATGLIGAAIINGMQSQKIGATVKHFCANNKEINRKYLDSRVSERALREIYLRAFEIAIKKANPYCVMTGYNLVNGERCASNWEQNNGILKGEWGYEGVVMTDWWAYSLLEDELCGGSDVKMPAMLSASYPGSPKEYDLCEKITNGEIDRGAALEAARRILTMMGKFD